MSQQIALRQGPEQRLALIGVSKVVKDMKMFAEQVARVDATILLRGETGVGKDHFADYIHQESGLERPLVPVHCAAIPDNMFESELFGHTKGAFTDASGPKHGLLKTAENSILFLNEIDTIPINLQSKVLRILDGRSYRELGSTREHQVNTRIIVGSNANLEEAVKQGRLREDLYFRISTLPFTVPPLRERPEDIPELVDHFFAMHERRLRFSHEAVSMMQKYHWPGNIRELRAMVTRASIMTPKTETIAGCEQIESYLLPKAQTTPIKRAVQESTPSVQNAESVIKPEGEVSLTQPYEEYVSACRKKYFVALLQSCNGNVLMAARVSGTRRTNLYRFIDKFQLRGLLGRQN